MPKLDKFHISEIDKKLATFNASHPKSASQTAETKKYDRIHELRDNAQAIDPLAKAQDDIFE